MHAWDIKTIIFDLYTFYHWRTIYVLWKKIVIFLDVITRKNFLDSLSNLTCSRNNTFVWMAGSAVSPIQEENDEKKKKMSFQELLWNFLEIFSRQEWPNPYWNVVEELYVLPRIWVWNIWISSSLCRTILYNITILSTIE